MTDRDAMQYVCVNDGYMWFSPVVRGELQKVWLGGPMETPGAKAPYASRSSAEARVSSAVGARIEAPKAPRRVGCGESVDVALPTGGGV